ncbi:MAG: glycosyltransferase family 61 protein [Alphaproteobacteria bacterium]|nr:glycosyltransferase family 61 protein [Alphaproteobacteria bacterium]
MIRENVDGQSRGIFRFMRPEMYFGKVAHAEIDAPSAYVLTNDNQVICHGLTARDYRTKKDFGRRLIGVDAQQRMLVSPVFSPHVVNEECIYFGGMTNFGHFIFQGLLRLALLGWAPKLRSLPIAVHEGMPARYYEFLDILGLPAERRIAIPNASPTQFAAVWLLSSPFYRDQHRSVMLWPEAVWAIRAATAHMLNSVSSKRTRLFIPRGRAKWRRVTNESEITRILTARGVETIDLESMSAADQIRSVSNAELIVSVNGAGSAITMFAPVDCVQMQFVLPEFIGSFGTRGFAADLSQPYFKVVGRIASEAEVRAADLEHRA